MTLKNGMGWEISVKGKLVPLTVADLRKMLENVPDDFQVIASADEEGNGFRQVYSITAQKVGKGQGYYSGIELAESERVKPNAVVIW
jgi:hypothetical protein